MDASTCLELALEGERLCKNGDFNGGVAFFEAAVQVGTNDMKTLSAIYSQLGNAYFYLGNYQKAMEYHKLDLTVARSIADQIGEAKASGNLGNTFKMLGRHDEAIMCCKRHLDISRELNDKVGEGRALYNLGNVYHTKGKSMARLGQQDPGDFPDEVKSCLNQAVDYYKQNLDLMVVLGDKSAQGRAYGNLGNTHYLLGNFTEAIEYHKKRLQIAVEFNDKPAQRRAHCNLGNAHIFLGEFEVAVDHYKKTLDLAIELSDRVVEAQACYSLGNTYTLLRDYKKAIEYHLRHLKIARELRDRIGEGRACWSLGNALSAVGDHQEALSYAQKHLDISKEIGDITGQTTAQMSIADLRKLIANDPKAKSCLTGAGDKPAEPVRPKRTSMEKMELVRMTPDQRKPLKTVEESSGSRSESVDDQEMSSSNDCISKSHEDFLDLLSKFQSKRMDDQRCALDPLENKENRKPAIEENVKRSSATSNASVARVQPVRSISHDAVPSHVYGRAVGSSASSVRSHAQSNHIDNREPSRQSPNNEQFGEELFDLIAGMQERRMDDQRAALPPIRRNSATNGPESLPGQRNRLSNLVPNNPHHLRMANRNPHPHPHPHPPRQMSLGANILPDDDFFEMLMRCQSSRLEDQRALIPGTSKCSDSSGPSRPSTLERPMSVTSTHDNSPNQVAPTVPDEDFFSLIMRFQAGRIEDQRSALPERPHLLHGQQEDEHMKGSSASSRKSSFTSNKSVDNSNSSKRSKE